ncbi:23S rRNA (uridine2552-2'-O)-methyltransferase [Gammaproteobacteria bacterium]
MVAVRLAWFISSVCSAFRLFDLPYQDRIRYVARRSGVLPPLSYLCLPVSRTKSSARWLDRHFSDPYVRQAQARGLPSRAAFKLEEIQQRDRLLRPGMTVVDLGAAPGGWSRVAATLVGPKGRVVALDLLPMEATAGVEFIQGDFRESSICERLLTTLGERRVGLVLSDMAPNLSGIPTVDQPRTLYLAELADEFAQRVLDRDGSLLMKVFQGEGCDAFIKQLRSRFKTVALRKPPASRPESREVYVLAKGFIV